MKSFYRKLFSRSRPTRRIAADNAGFAYFGRLDRNTSGSVRFIWQASSVAIEFEGDHLAIGFGDLQGQVYFDLELDGDRRILQARNGWVHFALAAGRHQLRLFKRSEANAGQVTFIGIDVAADAAVQRPVEQQRARYIFYGDSITVGACNEDGEEDQWLDRSSHNSALSYAALTAAAMDADYQNIAVSGIGVVLGYEPYTAGQTWDRMVYLPSAAPAPLQDWPAEVVFIHYGENDSAFTRNNRLPFPDSFAQEYQTLVRHICAAYPAARIVLLRGGMLGGASDDQLRNAWNAAIAQLKQEHSNIDHYVFRHCAPHHPRVTDHRHMAQELVSWLRQTTSHISSFHGRSGA